MDSGIETGGILLGNWNSVVLLVLSHFFNHWKFFGAELSFQSISSHNSAEFQFSLIFQAGWCAYIILEGFLFKSLRLLIRNTSTYLPVWGFIIFSNSSRNLYSHKFRYTLKFINAWKLLLIKKWLNDFLMPNHRYLYKNNFCLIQHSLWKLQSKW